MPSQQAIADTSRATINVPQQSYLHPLYSKSHRKFLNSFASTIENPDEILAEDRRKGAKEPQKSEFV